MPPLRLKGCLWRASSCAINCKHVPFTCAIRCKPTSSEMLAWFCKPMGCAVKLQRKG